MAIFNSYVTNYQRVTPSISHDWWWTPPDSHDLSQLSFGTSTGIPLATSSRCFTACACRHWLYYQIVSLIVISTYRPIYLPIYLTMIIYIYIYITIYILLLLLSLLLLSLLLLLLLYIHVYITIYTRIYYYIYICTNHPNQSVSISGRATVLTRSCSSGGNPQLRRSTPRWRRFRSSNFGYTLSNYNVGPPSHKLIYKPH